MVPFPAFFANHFDIYSEFLILIGNSSTFSHKHTQQPMKNQLLLLSVGVGN